jgi:hypothetical protein
VTEHDRTEQVTTHGCRIVCSCGWQSHPTLEESFQTRKEVVARWFDHYSWARRREVAA